MPNIGSPGLEEMEWIAETAQNPHTVMYDRYCDWADYNQSMKQMEAEARKVTSIKTKMGWSECKMFKRVASMPLHVFTLLRHVDKDFGRNNPEGIKRLRRFLMRRPEFRAD